ncbi:twin transmembrane helix small protein [Stakelama pacifica]|uniref:Hypoxia induced protein n=1 Tax=Stakelama pacifica TaxID=517720 RepID=A0A4R6FL80_9SPHN|nr:twin transmembrane helix small protein [Stakelama pacifica]MAX01254.1 hypothetical protein [Sphingomonas sp.]TDN81670.1 hypoxia induced protein [Stakelama pacifica]GGO96216.1 hypothetical protein GCM10011329_22220 [Stakelama pacifica]
MQLFLILCLIAAMIATVVALIRGIVTFLQTSEAELHGDGPSESSIKSNKMMQARILFQAVAVLIAVLLLVSVGGS